MTAEVFDAYAVLQVSQDADEGAIRAMHRELAKRYHPDRRDIGVYSDAMVSINRARDLLLDAAARATLDEALARRKEERAKPAASTAEAEEGKVYSTQATPPSMHPDAPMPASRAYVPEPNVPDGRFNPPRGNFPEPMDRVSMASLVAGLTCLGPAALILGIIGIIRTVDGTRRGRWAAVLGMLLGSVSTVVIAVYLSAR